MKGVSAERLLRLSVRVRGIELGRPVDLLLDQLGLERPDYARALSHA